MIENSHQEISENFNLWKYVEKYKPQIEAALQKYLPLAPANIETQFNEAVQYSLFPGGKRLRPVLTMLGAELVGGNAEDVLPVAVAVEFVHTSSLIFDDLPCMDNSEKRRGKTSLHEKFGEGLAVLVGLGFLNATYGLVFVNHHGLPERAMQAHSEITECVGASGMIGGQAIDLALAKGASTINSSSLDYEFESVRNLKTSALMRLALRTGAILAGADYLQLGSLSRFAELLGDAYQLSDDLIDLEEDEAIFNQNQSTFAIDHGQETARLRLKMMVEDAKRVLLNNFSPSEARSNLMELTDFLVERKS